MEHRSDTLFSKEFQKHTVRDAAVQDMDSVNAAAHSLRAVGELGQHSSADHTILDQLLCFRDGNTIDKGRRIIDILIKARYICQIDQLVRFDGSCDRAGRLICVDIVGV